MENNLKSWFEQYTLSDVTLKNRLVMAPLARMRCGESGIPNELVKEYYVQRSGFGMIITECSPISVRGNCIIGSAGIFTEEQVQGWKNIVDAVHKENCVICLQIWHCGRAVPETVFPKDLEPWGPSGIIVRGKSRRNGLLHAKPHEMTMEEINTVIEEFKQGAINAKKVKQFNEQLSVKAGFDFIELHGANGYLVDQFLRDFSNQRKDEYGGSIENRCRFSLKVIDEFIKIFGANRVGMRVSPTGRVNDMFDSDPLSLYSYLFKKLDEKGLAFVDIKEAGASINWDQENEFQTDLPKAHAQIVDCGKALRPFFSRTLINNDGFTSESGLKKINDGYCDLVSFGRLAIANPDLPIRFKNQYPLNQPNAEYYYKGGSQGYTDYLTYEQECEQKNKSVTK